MADYRKLIPFILKWEGGFADVKGDRGGATNKGVTLATFQSFYGRNKTASDLKAMTDAQWEHIFKIGFWDRWKADNIKSQSVANILVDWVWASGSYGIKIPQHILGVYVDGIVGENTINAVNNEDSRVLFDRIKNERINFVHRIVNSNPSQKKFLQGWVNRINAFKYE